MKLKDNIYLFKETIRQWSADKAPRLAAALSYYTLFSLAPLLVIIISIAGLAFGQQAAQNQIVGQITGLVGPTGAKAIQGLIQGASRQSSSIVATVIGVVILLFGAAGVFGQLQDALNTIWEVTPKPGRSIWNLVREHFFSFAMVLGIGFLLMVSLVLSAGLSALGDFVTSILPGMNILLQAANFLVSFIVITLLFALMFKYIPETEIRWRDVWLGAIVTALLFTIGKSLIGLYLGRSSVTSTYGAAGSLVVILLWFYYSGQILFFGAEFTKVYAKKFGSRIVPGKDAVNVSEAARTEQGITHQQTVKNAAEKGVVRGPTGQSLPPRPGAEPQGIAATGQPRRPARDGQRTDRIEEHPRRALTPSEKSMAALGGLLAALAGVLGVVGSVVVIKRRK